MKILIIRFSALGDVAMTVPVVKELAMTRPDADITVLSQPFCEPFFDGLAENVHFLGADIKKDYKGISGLNRLFRELDAMGFTHIADLHGVLRTHYLVLRFRLASFFGGLTFSYRKRGYRVLQIDKQRGDRKRITAPEGSKQLHQLTTSFEKYRSVLRSLLKDDTGEALSGWIDTTGQTFLPPLTFSSDEVLALLKNIPHSRKGLGVGLAPFAAHAGKIYPPELTERVIDVLRGEQPDCLIYLFGGGGNEEKQMREWQKMFPDNIIVAKDVVKGLREEMKLMSALDCMVSMDSANMHLASLVGTRVVSIWGATHPYAGFLGWHQSMDDCMQLDLPCRPCSIYGNKPCRRGDFACMKLIKPEDIAARILGTPIPSRSNTNPITQ